MTMVTTAKKTITSAAYATERLLAVLASGVVAIAGLLAMLGYGPTLEERLFPILTSQVVTDVSREGQSVKFRLTVEKERDCRLAAGDWAVKDGARHSPILVTNPIGRPVSSAVTYSPGTIDIGPFTASLPFDVEDGAYIYANLYYDCHFGWLSRQVMGPVPVPPA